MSYATLAEDEEDDLIILNPELKYLDVDKDTEYFVKPDAEEPPTTAVEAYNELTSSPPENLHKRNMIVLGNRKLVVNKLEVTKPIRKSKNIQKKISIFLKKVLDEIGTTDSNKQNEKNKTSVSTKIASSTCTIPVVPISPNFKENQGIIGMKVACASPVLTLAAESCTENSFKAIKPKITFLTTYNKFRKKNIRRQAKPKGRQNTVLKFRATKIAVPKTIKRLKESPQENIEKASPNLNSANVTASNTPVRKNIHSQKPTSTQAVAPKSTKETILNYLGQKVRTPNPGSKKRASVDEDASKFQAKTSEKTANTCYKKPKENVVIPDQKILYSQPKVQTTITSSLNSTNSSLPKNTDLLGFNLELIQQKAIKRKSVTNDDGLASKKSALSSSKNKTMDVLDNRISRTKEIKAADISRKTSANYNPKEAKQYKNASKHAVVAKNRKAIKENDQDQKVRTPKRKRASVDEEASKSQAKISEKTAKASYKESKKSVVISVGDVETSAITLIKPSRLIGFKILKPQDNKISTHSQQNNKNPDRKNKILRFQLKGPTTISSVQNGSNSILPKNKEGVNSETIKVQQKSTKTKSLGNVGGSASEINASSISTKIKAIPNIRISHATEIKTTAADILRKMSTNHPHKEAKQIKNVINDPVLIESISSISINTKQVADIRISDINDIKAPAADITRNTSANYDLKIVEKTKTSNVNDDPNSMATVECGSASKISASSTSKISKELPETRITQTEDIKAAVVDNTTKKPTKHDLNEIEKPKNTCGYCQHLNKVTPEPASEKSATSTSINTNKLRSMKISHNEEIKAVAADSTTHEKNCATGDLNKAESTLYSLLVNSKSKEKSTNSMKNINDQANTAKQLPLAHIKLFRNMDGSVGCTTEYPSMQPALKPYETLRPMTPKTQVTPKSLFENTREWNFKTQAPQYKHKMPYSYWNFKTQAPQYKHKMPYSPNNTVHPSKRQNIYTPSDVNIPSPPQTHNESYVLPTQPAQDKHKMDPSQSQETYVPSNVNIRRHPHIVNNNLRYGIPAPQDKHKMEYDTNNALHQSQPQETKIPTNMNIRGQPQIVKNNPRHLLATQLPHDKHKVGYTTNNVLHPSQPQETYKPTNMNIPSQPQIVNNNPRDVLAIQPPQYKYEMGYTTNNALHPSQPQERYIPTNMNIPSQPQCENNNPRHVLPTQPPEDKHKMGYTTNNALHPSQPQERYIPTNMNIISQPQILNNNPRDVLAIQPPQYKYENGHTTNNALHPSQPQERYIPTNMNIPSQPQCENNNPRHVLPTQPPEDKHKMGYTTNNALHPLQPQERYIPTNMNIISQPQILNNNPRDVLAIQPPQYKYENGHTTNNALHPSQPQERYIPTNMNIPSQPQCENNNPRHVLSTQPPEDKHKMVYTTNNTLHPLQPQERYAFGNVNTPIEQQIVNDNHRHVKPGQQQDRHDMRYTWNRALYRSHTPENSLPASVNKTSIPQHFNTKQSHGLRAHPPQDKHNMSYTSNVPMRTNSQRDLYCAQLQSLQNTYLAKNALKQETCSPNMNVTSSKNYATNNQPDLFPYYDQQNRYDMRYTRNNALYHTHTPENPLPASVNKTSIPQHFNNKQSHGLSAHPPQNKHNMSYSSNVPMCTNSQCDLYCAQLQSLQNTYLAKNALKQETCSPNLNVTSLKNYATNNQPDLFPYNDQQNRYDMRYTRNNALYHTNTPENPLPASVNKTSIPQHLNTKQSHGLRAHPPQNKHNMSYTSNVPMCTNSQCDLYCTQLQSLQNTYLANNALQQEPCSPNMNVTSSKNYASNNQPDFFPYHDQYTPMVNIHNYCNITYKNKVSMERPPPPYPTEQKGTGFVSPSIPPLRDSNAQIHPSTTYLRLLSVAEMNSSVDAVKKPKNEHLSFRRRMESCPEPKNTYKDNHTVPDLKALGISVDKRSPPPNFIQLLSVSNVDSTVGAIKNEPKVDDPSSKSA